MSPFGTQQPAPLPAPGSDVWLEGLPQGAMATVVVEVQDGLLVLSPPRVGGREERLEAGQRVVVTYRDRQVPCAVAAVVTEGDGKLMWAKPEGPGVRLQRRQAVRVPVQLIVRASPESALVEQIAGITENLSATGALVRLDRRLPVGSAARLTIDCGGPAGTVHVTGDVVRCEEGREASMRARPFRVAFAFRDGDRCQEDRLVHFLFERQRAIRRHEVDFGTRK